MYVVGDRSHKDAKLALQRELRIQVLRDGRELSLQLIPRIGWGGRGLLGCGHLYHHEFARVEFCTRCHIAPYRAS